MMMLSIKNKIVFFFKKFKSTPVEQNSSCELSNDPVIGKCKFSNSKVCNDVDCPLLADYLQSKYLSR